MTRLLLVRSNEPPLAIESDFTNNDLGRLLVAFTVAPVAMLSEPTPNASPLLAIKVPALTLTVLLKVLTPLSVTVPGPFLLMLLLPLIGPLRLRLAVGLTVPPV